MRLDDTSRAEGFCSGGRALLEVQNFVIIQLAFRIRPGIANQMTRYETRPAKREDEMFLYACYKQTMLEYVEQTWGWNEEFQRASFIEHLPWQRFQIITIGSIAVGGACISESDSCIDLEMIIIDRRFQRMGIGSDFLTDLLRRARKTQRPVALRVLKVNPARWLYQRLGFVVVGEDAELIEMRARFLNLPDMKQ
jgi:GNAT superfamily N-acetyltransferase